MRVWSDDLRGLILSGESISEIEASIPVAIGALVEAMGFGPVRVVRAHTLPSAARDHITYVVTAA